MENLRNALDLILDSPVREFLGNFGWLIILVICLFVIASEADKGRR